MGTRKLPCLSTRLIYPFCLVHRVATYQTCGLNVQECWQFFVRKLFCHNEENFVYLVLCIHEVPPDHYHLLNPCRLNSQIHYFEQEVGHYWEDFEDWQFWLLLWHTRYQSKGYPHFFAAFGHRTFPKLHLQKLLVNVTKFHFC